MDVLSLYGQLVLGLNQNIFLHPYGVIQLFLWQCSRILSFFSFLSPRRLALWVVRGARTGWLSRFFPTQVIPWLILWFCVPDSSLSAVNYCSWIPFTFSKVKFKFICLFIYKDLYTLFNFSYFWVYRIHINYFHESRNRISIMLFPLSVTSIH